MLKPYVEFRTELFPPCSENTDEWEGAVWGKTLAQYLDGQLKMRGLPAAGIHSEDWGYVINFDAPFHDSIWVGCGKYEEYTDGYLLMIEPKSPIIKRWFKADIDLIDQLTRLSNALNEILEQNPQIRDIKWWTAVDFER